MTDTLLITSALPYINGIKHLGNLAGSILPADVFARFQRLRGRDVVFVCGTDEHGTPAEIAAAKAGEPIEDYCTRLHTIQADIYRRFDISFDRFGRTSGAANHALTRTLFQCLDANGYIEARTIQQVWSEADHRFLPDRYVVGTCPHCGYTNARGDQCDGCTRLLDPQDLIAPRSAISGSTDLSIRDECHLFLKQSALAPVLRAWVEADGDWEPLVRSIALKWLDEGLEDRCITRNLDWGVQVPKPGFEHLKFYVWFDAPIGYLAILQEYCADIGTDWRDWIARGPGRRWVQFLGKDNVPFHALNFPATLLASGEDIRLVDRIKGLNWLTYGGRKFSTSQGVGVFTDDALDLFPADLWRWWLTANAPEGSDASFTFQAFADGVNADLADTIGNLVNRILRFAVSRFDGVIPTGGEPGPDEVELYAKIEAVLLSLTDHLDNIRLRKACSDLRVLWSLGNAYVSRLAPWSVIKTDPERAAVITRTTIHLIGIAAAASASVVPALAARIRTAIGLSETSHWPLAADLWTPGGQQIHLPDILVPRISDDTVAELTLRFAGTDPDTVSKSVS